MNFLKCLVKQSDKTVKIVGIWIIGYAFIHWVSYYFGWESNFFRPSAILFFAVINILIGTLMEYFYGPFEENSRGIF